MENNWQAEWESEVKVSGHASGWMPGWAHSDTQGFGQVQIKSRHNTVALKTRNSNLQSQWRKLMKIPLHTCIIYFSKISTTRSASSPQAAAGTAVLWYEHTPARLGAPVGQVGWRLLGGISHCLTDSGCWAQLIPINWSISCAPNIWLRQGPKRHFCTPHQPTLSVSLREDG